VNADSVVPENGWPDNGAHDNGAQDGPPGNGAIIETQDIGDFPCRRYDVIVGSTKESEVWATSWKDAGVDRDAFEVFRDMAQLFREMLSGMPRLAEQRKVFSGVDEIDAFPVLIRDFENESVTTETVFDSVDERDVDAGLYEIPDGYSERPMFE